MASRRQFITGIGTAGTVAIAGCSGGDGGSETSKTPDKVVLNFVEYLQDQNNEAAREMLHEETNENLTGLLGNWYDEYTEDDLTNLRAAILDDNTEPVEVELIYNNNDDFNPSYDYGSLFYLRNNGTTWKISGFNGSHRG